MSNKTMANEFHAKVIDGEGKWRLRFKTGKGENTHHRNIKKAHANNAKTNDLNRGWKKCWFSQWLQSLHLVEPLFNDISWWS